MRLLSLIFGIILLFTSCEKLDENYNKIPEDAPRLTDLQREYQEILVANTDGWFMEYQPGTDNPSVPILMKFSADGRVSMISDRYGFDEEIMSTYRVEGVIGPELIFDTYSVYSSIAESGGGVSDFRMYPQENGEFILKHAAGGLETEFRLRKAQPTDLDDIIARASVGRVLQEFSENSSAYFRNLVLDNISAFWELNVNTQQVTLTWENSSGGSTTTQTFSYTTLPGDGIRLAQPWIAPGGIEVTEIFFGNATPDGIEIISAGNAGAGEVEVAHIPAFPYPGMADLYMFSNSLRPNQTTQNFLGYTLDRTRISPDLQPYYDAVANAMPSFWRIQVNYNATAATPRNYFTLMGRDDDGNLFHEFTYDFTKADESHVNMQYRSAGGYAKTVRAPAINTHPDVWEFLDRIYPPEGVTVVPIGVNQRLRVVSRANSNYWIDLTISTPANALP